MIESFNLLHPEAAAPTEKGKSAASARIFLAAIVIGLALRLVAAFYGDIGPGGDGVQRLANAVKWAAHPVWEGFSGVWPPTHWYFLGSLIRLWHHPIILAKTVNFVCGFGALFALRRAVRPVFGDLVASVCTLLLAIFWTHIWLTTAYWVELPYLLLVFLSAGYAMRGLNTPNTDSAAPKTGDALKAGVFLALAMLLRHEGLILFGLFGLWYLLNVKRLPVIVAFAFLPVCIATIHFVEPRLSGHSYFEYAAYVKDAKASENLVQGFTLVDCLRQWIQIPATVPSLLVVIPGLYGLWKARRLARYDLFAWMFVAQVLFYLMMTFTSGWRPQLRYVMLYFVNLLPYAALAWVQLMQRFPKRPVLTILVVLTVLMQAVGWWIGRNERRPMGWLPVQIPSSAQIALDEWVLRVKNEKPGATIAAITPGSLTDAWSFNHSVLVDDVAPRAITLVEAYVPEAPIILKGQLPASVATADAILVDPNALFYPKVLNGIKNSGQVRQKVAISSHITAFLTPEFARRIPAIATR